MFPSQGHCGFSSHFSQWIKASASTATQYDSQYSLHSVSLYCSANETCGPGAKLPAQDGHSRLTRPGCTASSTLARPMDSLKSLFVGDQPCLTRQDHAIISADFLSLLFSSTPRVAWVKGQKSDSFAANPLKSAHEPCPSPAVEFCLRAIYEKNYPLSPHPKSLSQSGRGTLKLAPLLPFGEQTVAGCPQDIGRA